MKCGEATLPERLQIQSTTAVDPYLFVEISTHNIEVHTLRRISSVAFTLIMTNPCFTTPNSCCRSTIRKGDVTKKPNVPNTNDCDWYVCMERQRRTIASIDDRTDGNNRPNKRNRTIDILLMIRIVMTTMMMTTMIHTIMVRMS